MDISKIRIGENPPHDVNVIIEIPANSDPVKYEVDKESGALFVDRFMHTAMYYPADYGFVPHTLAEDGDPLDFMVMTRARLIPGAVVRCRPVGVLLMEDEAGPDEKLLGVPLSSAHPYYDHIQTYEQLPPILMQQIQHFFEHYKDLEGGKWAKVTGWGGVYEAKSLITSAIARHKEAEGKA
ncbi:MAG: inorganic diphosphatase [Alphaproteobacteria bacterium]|nr:inorganic diphosphatase [Alphaproteobacteria bacterium]MDX5369196.1 inorganic diphosphatase [Alphaproteobacteria bacterium]MDX5463892.1 inorganic diphosphatase [Alphaproteobacteria bacterium]